MQYNGLLDVFPIWAVFVVTLLVVVSSVDLGHRLGRYRRLVADHENEAPVGAMVGAVLGLLAFFLAFTFGMAATRFDTRKQLLLDEANAIGTTNLRADLLPEPHRGEVRALLREYVDVRIRGVVGGDLADALRQSESLHARIWAHAVACGEKNPTSVLLGLFIQSLNEVIDLHTKRVTAGLRNRVPDTIWVVLYAVAVLAMLVMGYSSGLSGARRSLAVVPVALTFSSVMWLIVDLDRPQQGLLRVGQQAMIDLQTSMTAAKP